MLSYKDKVAMRNARNALERHCYCQILPGTLPMKILWKPKNYLDYLMHLSQHRLRQHAVRAVFHINAAMTQTYPTHLQCSTCGLITPMEDWRKHIEQFISE